MHNIFGELNNGYRDTVVFLYGGVRNNYIPMTEVIKQGLAPLNKEIKIKISLDGYSENIKRILKDENQRISTKYVNRLSSDIIIWREIEENEEYEIISLNTYIVAEKRLKIRSNYRGPYCKKDHNYKKTISIDCRMYGFYEDCAFVNKDCQQENIQSEISRYIEIEDPKCPECGGNAYIYDIEEIDNKEIELCKCRGNVDKQCNFEFKRISKLHQNLSECSHKESQGYCSKKCRKCK